MWSIAKGRRDRKEETKQEPEQTTKNVRFIHMQISTPMTKNKTRAQKVKEALMIIFATSKHIKLHPKAEGTSEIISNIDDLITTEEVTSQYFFDKKKGGKRFIRGEGAVEYYVTKVRLETDISLAQMKWKTSMRFLDALRTQNIFLKEFQDGKIMKTGNVGWLVGINPTSTSESKVTRDLNKILQQIEATAILDIHTVSIRFPATKNAFVTRAYKIMSEVHKVESARHLISETLKEKKMGVGWEGTELVSFNADKNTTAMMIERHNTKLHNTAVIAIKNVWSITEKDDSIGNAEISQLGLDASMVGANTIEEIWWSLANIFQHDIQGMVTRRGTLEVLTTRKNLDETVGFVRELVKNTIQVLGEERFARVTANHNPEARKPMVQEAPMILEGKGRVHLDPTHFTEQEFKAFARKHGIPLDNKEEAAVVNMDTTRPPKAFFHKAGREPVEHDPRKLRDGAIHVWEKFTEKKKQENRKKTKEVIEINEETNNTITDKATTQVDIVQNGKFLRLETSLRQMKASQQELEATTHNCQEQMVNMTKRTEDSIDKMSEMITKMGDSITIQNRQLEAQAKAQVKQAEDIQRIMAAIHAISSVVQAPQSSQDDSRMQIDIPKSGYNKRKQTSIGLTTPFTIETQESTIAPPSTAESLQSSGVHSAGRQ
jgi:hypothetical protein